MSHKLDESQVGAAVVVAAKIQEKSPITDYKCLIILTEVELIVLEDV